MKTLENHRLLFLAEKVCRNLVPESIATYGSHIKLFNAWYAGKYSKFPQRISKQRLNEYAAHLVRSGISDKSIVNRLKAINQFVEFMRSRGVRIKSDAKADMIRVSQPMKKSFLICVIERIIQSLDITNCDSVLCVFLLSTGVRSKTVRAAKVRDIDFSTKIMQLNHSKNRRNNSIPIADPLLDILRKHIRHHNLSTGDYIFFNRFGNQLTRSTIYERINRYLRQIGVEQTGVHIFRHSFAKIEVLNGVDTVTLQRLMTHQSIEESSEYVELFSRELVAKQNQFNILCNKNYASY